MSYRAIYAYAWDLADEGVSPVIEQVAALGINTITVAGSYHAGKFLRPHGRSGKVYFPEDGTVYFNADPSRYGAIKPVASSLVRERDVLRELTGARVAVNVWLVLLHNSRLGERHPRSRPSGMRSVIATSTASVPPLPTSAAIRRRAVQGRRARATR